MLYLEDYLEMIEHLPQELRDRFTEMREMDLSVQNNMDSLEKRVRVLFSGCRRGEVSGDQASAEFSEIKKGYNRTLEDADEKVTLANQMYELVERYLRRLDSELHKFKCELEADNKGITELLEKRSLEMDVPSGHGQNSQSNHYKDNRYRVRAEKRRDSWGVGVGGAPSRPGATALVAAPAPITLSRTDSAIQAALNRDASSSGSGSNGGGGGGSLSVGTYNLGHVGAGTAIAAAASQAIAATQQLQQGRRTASLKASLEAVNLGELGLGRELAVAAHTAIQAAQHDNTHHHQGHHSSSHAHHSASHQSSHTQQSSSSNANKRHKKKSTYSSSSSAMAGHPQSASRSSSPSLGSLGISTSTVPAIVAPLMEEPLTDGEWTYDPNEPRYCICNQVSYGDMVACDNEDCPFEWFHYQCVGITAPPKGKWYCPQCNTNMRRSRANRKN